MTATTDILQDFRSTLRGLDASAVDTLDDSRLGRALYSSDASIYRVVPTAVAHPRSTDELCALVTAACHVGLPLTTRGAGTTCAGNAVGTGLIIDTSKHLDRILSLDPESATAVVEPGVVQNCLQQAGAPHHLRFGPDPSTSTRCTIGGMIGNNACGPRALGYGRTGDNIVDLDLLTADGRITSLRPGDLTPAFAQRLADLADANLGTIRTEFATFSRQVSGYSMEWLLPERGRNLPSFIAGSEATLGIVTRATVRLVREAPYGVTVALGYPSMPEAADAVTALLPFSPVACEGFGRRIVDVVARAGRPVPDLPRGDGWMFVELRGDDEAEVASRAKDMVSASGCLDGWVVCDPGQASALWKIRADGAGLAGVSLDKPAWAGWEDSAVPAADLGAYLRDFESLLEDHGLHGLPYGHFGEGCLHCRIDFPLDQPDGPQRYRSFITEAAHLVAQHGGSVSGEHGDGRARSALLETMYSREAVDLFGKVKAILDPDNMFNPGILVNPAPLEASIRTHESALSAITISHPDFAREVHRCTGVGKCIAHTASGGLMCPSYQASGLEVDSTRGRASVLKEMVNGTLIGGWDSPEVERALDLCMACKGCARDCPTGIDMASYRSTVLNEKYRHRLRPRSHVTMGLLPLWERLINHIPGAPALANTVLSVPVFARLARWTAGIDQRRPIPRFQASARLASGNATSAQRIVADQETPASSATETPSSASPSLTRHKPDKGDVVIWVDSFSDMLEGSDLSAVVAVLADAGYHPRVLSDNVCCGLSWITTGQLNGARRRLRAGVAVLAPLADANVPVVGLEPSCTTVWRDDALRLLPDDPRVGRVARNMCTVAELLEAANWTPPSLAGHTVVAQPHCHHASILGFGPDKRLLEAAGARVTVVGGCCGYAGNFGVENGHYDFSVKVAQHDLLPAIDEAGEQAIILADGFSCRRQISDLAGRRALTLSELFASHLPARTPR
ncbi:FAD-binding and (Fe-S)-binding domain-containing protein [Cutibacterium equinum]|uniref:FAD-binding and (Fe-S)-binding domain-containing protein n=1 Tax=Cutibacterium equinum TaxID=3016342 RepID=A0ABY7QY49_9ACTN|nr:FAD-binding and (Fe-S)-binding domain-containing protein [Cutibacterium equinum]WCC79349.1 FAD-binding and (Fe-S)-binding domain-containing protein [Cutibacterium equinum]